MTTLEHGYTVHATQPAMRLSVSFALGKSVERVRETGERRR